MLSSQRLWPRSWSSCVAFIVPPFSGSHARVASIIPQSDHGLGPVVLVAQLAQARGPKQEVSGGAGLDAEPAGGEHSQDMPAREEQDVPLNRAHTAHHSIRPGADL